MPGRKVLRVLCCTAAALYPAVVFALLVVLKLPVRLLSLFVIGLAAAFFLSATGTGGNGERRFNWKPLLSSALLFAAGFFCFFTNQKVFLKLYSVAVSAVFLLAFASTLFFPPNMVFRFATLADKTIRGSAYEAQVRRYCWKVTVLWCAFFVCNGTAAVCTALFASDMAWSLYNGGISYVLMGLLFAGEFIVRKITDKRMKATHFITKFKADSRADDYILCYDDVWSKQNYKTWKDFLEETAKIRRFVNENGAQDWILHCEDYWNFLVVFVALLQCKRRVLLTQNITENFIAEIKHAGTEFLTDQKTPEHFRASYVPELLEVLTPPTKSETRDIPVIEADETQILMYTSGSTGRPKAVLQRMTEFEIDNAFVISKWGEEFTRRKLVATVSQHHIYGFLFTISLPFALGVPFRRKRITFPEEFEKLTRDSYMIIASPAFLKRTVDSRGGERLSLNEPWIFTSGGAVSPDLAVSTHKVFGVYPLEVYGSTETSGIAYRQQNTDGLWWTPFANAKVWADSDGCLKIVSPYIKDPEGFATADLVEFSADGEHFLLKGRSDSIVKIEEKRISLTEVENRLLQTGLVKDAKVVALSNEVRQFLAAAVVLNDEGKAKFEGQEKFCVNKYFRDFLAKYFENVVLPKKFRYLDALPADVQGKKHKEEIAVLFDTVQE